MIELFFALRLSIRFGSGAFRFRTVMLLVVVSPPGKLVPVPPEDVAFDMLCINWAAPEDFIVGDIVGKLRLAVAFGSPLCAFTIILGPGSTFRTVAEPGVVFVITRSCFRPRLAPKAEGFMDMVELAVVFAADDDELSNDGLVMAIR